MQFTKKITAKGGKHALMHSRYQADIDRQNFIATQNIPYEQIQKLKMRAKMEK
jgi:hypothetical protein